MTRNLILMPMIVLAACDNPAPKGDARTAPLEVGDLAAQLAEQPKELADLRRRCRSEPQVVGADTCSTVARATRIQLTRSGPSAYAPGVVSGASGNEASRP